MVCEISASSNGLLRKKLIELLETPVFHIRWFWWKLWEKPGDMKIF